MIKIRYADLPGGLHARAEARGRHTVIIYLLPGLTVPQRRAVLRRLRSSARVGHGPLLSRAGIARAMAADRIRTNVRNAAAALRVHPGILAPPVLLTVAAAVAFVLMVPVPGEINATPAPNPGAVFHQSPTQTGPPPYLPGGGLPLTPVPKQRPVTVDHPRSLVQLAASPDLGPPAPPRRPKPPAGPRPKVTGTPTRPPSPAPSPKSPSPTPSPSASPRSAPSAAPSPSPSAAPSLSASSGLCIYLVVTGACL